MKISLLKQFHFSVFFFGLLIGFFTNSIWNPAKIFPCAKGCGKVYNSRATMVRHVSLDCNDKRFECPLCHKVFKRKYHLNRHYSKHITKMSKDDAENMIMTPVPITSTTTMENTITTEQHIEMMEAAVSATDANIIEVTTTTMNPPLLQTFFSSYGKTDYTVDANFTV